MKKTKLGFKKVKRRENDEERSFSRKRKIEKDVEKMYDDEIKKVKRNNDPYW